MPLQQSAQKARLALRRAAADAQRRKQQVQNRLGDIPQHDG